MDVRASSFIVNSIRRLLSVDPPSGASGGGGEVILLVYVDYCILFCMDWRHRSCHTLAVVV